MKKSPLITVLMSCFNASRWLSFAIESVLKQTFIDFEFIIIDDGSNDNTKDIIVHYMNIDSRIRFVSKSNTGLTNSLNFGIDLAKGSWIARLDADDICESNRLELQLAKAQENSELVLIFSNQIIIDENGCKGKLYKYPKKHVNLHKNLIKSKRFPPHSSAFFSTSVVREIGKYRTRIYLSQDDDLWLRLSEVGKMYCIEHPLVYIRKHSQQISNIQSGYQQRIYSNIALISYWCRQYGYQDPVLVEQGKFNVFYNFVEDRLKKEYIHEYYNYISKLKRDYLLNRLSYVLSKFEFNKTLIFSYLLKANFAKRTAKVLKNDIDLLSREIIYYD